MISKVKLRKENDIILRKMNNIIALQIYGILIRNYIIVAQLRLLKTFSNPHRESWFTNFQYHPPIQRPAFVCLELRRPRCLIMNFLFSTKNFGAINWRSFMNAIANTHNQIQSFLLNQNYGQPYYFYCHVLIGFLSSYFLNFCGNSYFLPQVSHTH